MHRGYEKNCRGITNSVQSIRSKNGVLKVTERAILLHDCGKLWCLNCAPAWKFDFGSSINVWNIIKENI
jgi:hypothetical protein